MTTKSGEFSDRCNPLLANYLPNFDNWLQLTYNQLVTCNNINRLNLICVISYVIRP